MSGYSGNLKKGEKVLHKGEIRVVRDWIFVSSSVHNSDEIIVLFEEGSSHLGLYGIETKEDLEKELDRVTKALALFNQ